MYWLDVSGMALYLLERLRELALLDFLPGEIRARLEQNLEDNSLRTSSLFADMVEISGDFDAAGIRFSNQKGLTLPVDSAPCSNLRCQMDLDFLVAAEDGAKAREVLEQRGYRLHAVSGSTMEFNTAASRLPTIKELYKPRTQRSVELHLVAQDQNLAAANRLGRARMVCLCGVEVRALSPADHLILQGLHLFKHLRSDFTRMSWLLEFTRHVAARRNDCEFWNEVRERASECADTSVALGAGLLLASKVFDSQIPQGLAAWTVAQLAPPVALWMETYGRRAALSETPGTKLYLLLEAELAASRHGTKPVSSQRLIRFSLPRMVVQGAPGDSAGSHLARYAQQAKYLVHRVRFHLREGLRYRIERARWIASKRALAC